MNTLLYAFVATGWVWSGGVPHFVIRFHTHHCCSSKYVGLRPTALPSVVRFAYGHRACQFIFAFGYFDADGNCLVP